MFILTQPLSCLGLTLPSIKRCWEKGVFPKKTVKPSPTVLSQLRTVHDRENIHKDCIDCFRTSENCSNSWITYPWIRNFGVIFQHSQQVPPRVLSPLVDYQNPDKMNGRTTTVKLSGFFFFFSRNFIYK